METVTFYDEWLKLPKAQFNILYMLADKGGSFCGKLAELCDYFGFSRQTKNRNNLEAAIVDLTAGGYIISEKSGYTYTLRVIPKEKENAMLRRWLDAVLQAEKFSESVSKSAVIKAFPWISQHNNGEIVTNAEIAQELDISVNTLGCAKNVLERDLGIITREIVKVDYPNGERRNVGQRLGEVVPWTII